MTTSIVISTVVRRLPPKGRYEGFWTGNTVSFYGSDDLLYESTTLYDNNKIDAACSVIVEDEIVVTEHYQSHRE